ncbi:MAG: RNA-binding protein [Clostridia bacterium]|nr:RNA-binding protein [Clostridia bacterium]
MEKDEKILVASVLDKAKRAAQKNIPVCTAFLDLHQQELVRQERKQFEGTTFLLWGGYPDAERKIAVFLPDYLDAPPEDVLSAVRVDVKNTVRLTHRDYLGSVLGTGLKREQIGDILPDEAGAYVLVKSDIADFLTQNLLKVARENVSCETLRLSEVAFAVPEPKSEMTVSANSLRLDKITAEAFKVSRTDASAAILAGKVFVNQKEVLKPDHQLSEGDKITFRGKGKAELSTLLGLSKKGKQRLLLKIY